MLLIKLKIQLEFWSIHSEMRQWNFAFYIKLHCFYKYRARFRLINETSVCERIDLTNIRVALDKTITVLSRSGGAGPSRKALRYRDTYTRLVVVVNRERMDGRKDRGG